MTRRMECLLDWQDKDEAIDILSFVMALSPEERHDFRHFAHGVEYGINAARKEALIRSDEQKNIANIWAQKRKK